MPDAPPQDWPAPARPKPIVIIGAGCIQQIPLTGSWFIESFIGPMRNPQGFDVGADDRLFSGLEDAFHTMALIEACFVAATAPAIPLQTA